MKTEMDAMYGSLFSKDHIMKLIDHKEAAKKLLTTTEYYCWDNIVLDKIRHSKLECFVRDYCLDKEKLELIMIGRLFSNLGENETGSQFRTNVENELMFIFNKQIICSIFPIGEDDFKIRTYDDEN